MVTVMVGVVGVGALLVDEGIITIEKRGENHTKTVIVDGEVTEHYNWSELMGYEVKIDVVDGAYIGR